MCTNTVNILDEFKQSMLLCVAPASSLWHLHGSCVSFMLSLEWDVIYGELSAAAVWSGAQAC